MNNTMFRPKFDVTTRIKVELEDIERTSWLVDHMLIMPKHETWIRREIHVQRAVGTTSIEGVPMDEASVAKLARRGAGGIPSEDERANLNALRAYEFIDYLSDQPDIPINELVIRELNRQFMHGAVETLTPGMYRKGQNRVGLYMPPDQGDVPVLMRSFADWLQANGETHPILKAGIAHIHLVAIHPFWDGNGRTARGLATLILQRSPYGFRKLLSLESLLAEMRDQYIAAIERTLGTHFDAEYDATSWLEFITFTLYVHTHRFEARLTDLHRMMEHFYQLMQPLGLSQRQVDGLLFASRTGQITRADYIEIAGVSAETASRDLALLVRKNLLTAKGRTRDRIYLPRAEPAPQSTGEAGAEQLPLFDDARASRAAPTTSG